MGAAVSSPAICRLREQIQRLEGTPLRARTVLPFGVSAIDGHLPGGGLALGALHEVAGGGNAAIDGAAAALFAAGIAARTKGKVLWCITRQDLFAPALAQVGLGSDRVIYVDACDEKSVLACFEEGVPHGGLGAVVAEVARLSIPSSRGLTLASPTLQACWQGRRRHSAKVLTFPWTIGLALETQSLSPKCASHWPW